MTIAVMADSGPSATQNNDLRFSDSLVGRGQELAQLEQILATSLAGQPQFVWLEGVAGIGKSHLAAALAERARQQGCRVCWGVGDSTQQTTSYYPWQQIVIELLGIAEAGPAGLSRQEWLATRIARLETIITALNPNWLIRLPLLGDLLGWPIPDNATTAAFEPQLRQDALFGLVADLLQTLTQKQPLLLLLDECQWLDEASHALLLSLSRLQAELPLLIVALCNPLSDIETWTNKPPESPHIHRLKLSRLSAPTVAELVNQQLGGQVTPLLVELIQAYGQSNPLLVEELILAWRDAGQVERQADGFWQATEALVQALKQANSLTQDAAGQWRLVEPSRLAAVDLELPDSLERAIASRLDCLPAPLQETLTAASVIGSRFEVELLVAVHPGQLDEETVLKLLEELQKAEFIRPEQAGGRPIYRFTPGLGQAIAYASLFDQQKRAIHGAVAAALEQRQPEAVERLAYHFGRSDAQDKLLIYLERAAGRAQRLFANETVLTFYAQALAIEERWSWRSSQVRTLHVLGRREEERANLEALATNLETPTVELAFLWGQYFEAIANYPKAQEAIELALADSRDKEDLIGQSRCLVYLGLIARRQGSYQQAKAWYQQALAKLHNVPNLTEPEGRGLIEVYNGLGAVYSQQGEFEQSRQCHEEALRLSRRYGNRSGEAQACNDLGVIAFYQRQLEEAAAYYQQALDIRRAIGNRTGEGSSLHNFAQVALHIGDYGQAQKYLSEALRILRTVDDRWDEINVLNDLGILYQELGDWPKAEACLQQGLAVAQKIGDQAGQAYILANLGLVARDKGKLETAENFFTTGLILARAQQDQYLASSLLNYLGSVSLQLGQPEQAITQTKASLALRRELKVPYAIPDNLAILAASYLALGDLAEAVERATQAEQILVECGGEGPEFPQQDYYLIYQVLTAVGQFKRAEQALESAHKLVMARANKIIDPYLRQSFLERVTLNRTIVNAYKIAMTTALQN